MNFADILPKRSRHAIISSDAGGVLTANNPVTGRVFILNDVGRRIIELSDGTNSVDQIVGRICSEFHGARPEEVRVEVEEFLSACIDAQLIEQ